MKSKILASALVITGFIIGASALSAAAAWSDPQSTPPNCTSGQPGCDAPLHVGSLLQTKTGPLQLNWLTNGFAAIGLQLNGKIQINDASADVNTVGSVLTNEGNGVGSWKSIGSVASGMKSFTSSGSWSIPAGAKFAKVTVVGSGGYVAQNGVGGGQVITTGYPGKVVFKVVPLSGVYTVSATVGAVPAGSGYGSFVGGNSSVTIGGQTIVAAGGLSSTGSSSGDFSIDGPYMTYGHAGTGDLRTDVTGGLVLVEYY